MFQRMPTSNKISLHHCMSRIFLYQIRLPYIPIATVSEGPGLRLEDPIRQIVNNLDGFGKIW
jgi:hypothetical protein